jgi:hypothetical protein
MENSVTFEVDQKSKNESTDSKIDLSHSTLLIPNKSCALNLVIEYFRSKNYDDHISADRQLHMIEDNIKTAFKKFTKKDFEGKIIRLLYTTHFEDCGERHWRSRDTIITFSQENKFYYFHEDWCTDSDYSETDNFECKEITDNLAKELTIEDLENWTQKLTRPVGKGKKNIKSHIKK